MFNREGTEQVKHEGLAEKALRESNEAASWAFAIAKLAEERLNPIIDPIGPEDACAHGDPNSLLPPLFEEWRASRNRLYEALGL